MCANFHENVNSAIFFKFDKYTAKNDVFFLHSWTFDKYELFLNKKMYKFLEYW